MPSISVIVPCHNVTGYLGKAMEQLLQQTIGLENMEIILVDDASTDDGATLSMMMEYEQRYPENIIVIPLKENMRQGGARNIGLLYASGEYIAYCDADDWFVTGALKRLYELAKKYDCDVVEFDNRDVRDYRVTDEIIRSGEKADECWEVISADDRRRNLIADSTRSTLGCWNKLYRASMLKENQIRYAEHVTFEEPSFTYMVRFYEKRHYYVHEVLHYALQSSGSTMRSSYAAKKYDNMITHETLLSDFVSRGAMDEYREEIEFIFWWWYFYSTLMFAVRGSTFYTREEFIRLQQKTAAVVRNIGNNRYFTEHLGMLPQLADLTYCRADGIDMEKLRQVLSDLFDLTHNRG